MQILGGGGGISPLPVPLYDILMTVRKILNCTMSRGYNYQVLYGLSDLCLSESLQLAYHFPFFFTMPLEMFSSA